MGVSSFYKFTHVCKVISWKILFKFMMQDPWIYNLEKSGCVMGI